MYINTDHLEKICPIKKNPNKWGGSGLSPYTLKLKKEGIKGEWKWRSMGEMWDPGCGRQCSLGAEQQRLTISYSTKVNAEQASKPGHLRDSCLNKAGHVGRTTSRLSASLFHIQTLWRPNPKGWICWTLAHWLGHLKKCYLLWSLTEPQCIDLASPSPVVSERANSREGSCDINLQRGKCMKKGGSWWWCPTLAPGPETILNIGEVIRDVSDKSGPAAAFFGERLWIFVPLEGRKGRKRRRKRRLRRRKRGGEEVKEKGGVVWDSVPVCPCQPQEVDLMLCSL